MNMPFVLHCWMLSHLVSHPRHFCPDLQPLFETEGPRHSPSGAEDTERWQIAAPRVEMSSGGWLAHTVLTSIPGRQGSLAAWFS